VCESAKQSAANAWNTRTAADRAVLAELLDELEVNQAGYDMAGGDEARQLDVERKVIRGRIFALLTESQG
jgi:hypothetical protein